MPGFLAKLELYRPGWVAFHGKTAAGVVARRIGHPRHVRLGLQPWSLGAARVYVLPSASGSNRDPSRLEGKWSRLAWFRAFRQLLDRAGDAADPA